MAVFDAVSNPGSNQSADASWTHTPVGTPRGASVWIVQPANDTDQVLGVTYGGETLARIGSAVISSGEVMRVYLYFLGTGLPTGEQTVEVDIDATGALYRPYCITQTGDDDTEVIDWDVVETITADPSVTLSNPNALTAWVGAIMASGQGTVGGHSAGANYTSVGSIDPGNTTARIERITTESTATSIVADFVQTSDEACMIAAAIAEITSGGVVVAPAEAAAAGSVVAPTIVLGSLTIGPAAAAAVGAVVAPGILSGSIAVTPAVAAAVGTVVDPTVEIEGGSEVVSPAAAEAVGDVAAPTITFGSVTVAPTVAEAIGATVDPTVIEAPGRRFGPLDEPLSPFWTPEVKPSYSPWI